MDLLGLLAPPGPLLLLGPLDRSLPVDLSDPSGQLDQDSLLTPWDPGCQAVLPALCYLLLPVDLWDPLDL